VYRGCRRVCCASFTPCSAAWCTPWKGKERPHTSAHAFCKQFLLFLTPEVYATPVRTSYRNRLAVGAGIAADGSTPASALDLPSGGAAIHELKAFITISRPVSGEQPRAESLAQTRLCNQPLVVSRQLSANPSLIPLPMGWCCGHASINTRFLGCSGNTGAFGPPTPAHTPIASHTHASSSPCMPSLFRICV
jgi:hypothetical protein